MRISNSKTLVLLAAAVWCCGCFVILKEARIASRLVEVEGGVVTLDEPLFDLKVARTGVFSHCKFQKVIGFGIFETSKHKPQRLPVLLMHGHADGPRSLKSLAHALDKERFTPLFAYFPTGQKLSYTVKSMHKALTALAKKKKISTLAIVAYSMSGLIARKYLGERWDKNTDPRVSVLITISTPWLGSERGARWTWSPTAPPSWKDMSPSSDFLNHLYDRPLPESTDFHMLYGTKGDGWNIPGPDDTVISIKSASRKEAASEADSVTLFPECDHRAIVTSQGPLSKVAEILEKY